MTARSSTVAFLGTGLMGSRQARRLLDAGYHVVVWNRSPDKAHALVPFGARVAETAAAAAAAAPLTIAMLENGRIVDEVLFRHGAAAAMPRGGIFVDMSSIKPAEAQHHAAQLGESGVRHIDAPVSGGTVGAEQGTLAIMAGGDADAYRAVEPVLRIMGRPTHVGGHGAGQLAKLANQIIVAGTIGAVAEALILAERGGADPAKVRDALRGGFADSRVLELHGDRMIRRDFTLKGRSVTHLKDLDNALDAARTLGLGFTPFTAATEELFRGLLEHFGDLDHSGLFAEIERRNRPLPNPANEA
ncbi:MAG: NAD(P)-dependent oxidoreductase [Rhodoplanes sp.]|uniref:NAD(P)-dependent oxidoreductase n=1 Tax=Rhodoplanes sp. TaxID=1968906 RepID=UPI0018463468|nr:NAD(P)-dependent oxidoreductase [Rhodoplanes sp.]NVO16291.1 NAD(P)-dependent oxidoreductase [Rhodoplanes sp.]